MSTEIGPVTGDVRAHTGGGRPADEAALAALQDYRAKELGQLQQRSEKWIPGIAAVTGVLTTAVVVKGAESFAKLAESRTLLGLTFPPQSVIIGLMLVGGILIAAGVYFGYTAAHGQAFTDDPLIQAAMQQQLEGAYERWTTAAKGLIDTTRSSLKLAVGLTLLGTILLAAAVLLTWTTPTAESGDTSICISVDGKPVKVSAVPEVKSGSLVVIPCG